LGRDAGGGEEAPEAVQDHAAAGEKRAADEHDRFLHALLLFGRDWKRIEQFVATKTATQSLTINRSSVHGSIQLACCVFQIRSHAQKYFLKAQKLGFEAALPPRRVADGHHSVDDELHGFRVSVRRRAAERRLGARLSRSRDCWPSRSGGEPGGASWAAAATLAQEDEMIQLPLPPGHPRFALVYRFVGDAQLRRLQGIVDPVVVDTILLVLRNLQDNLFA
uniref:Uncharacterized protein n=1 Tax=Setaria italica TaxID=4555 RepID=K3YCZ7_SETIT